LIDLDGVELIDSTGLAALVRAKRSADRRSSLDYVPGSRLLRQASARVNHRRICPWPERNEEEHMLTIVLIIVVILLLTGGGLGYRSRGRRF
jgi:hypothetical protein